MEVIFVRAGPGFAVADAYETDRVEVTVAAAPYTADCCRYCELANNVFLDDAQPPPDRIRSLGPISPPQIPSPSAQVPLLPQQVHQ